MDKEEKQRTIRQNSALHLGFAQIAQELRAKDLTVGMVLEKGIEFYWTETLVKEALFKPIAKIMFDKDSTTQLTTKELQEVWESMSQAIGQSGVYVPYPSSESEMLRNLTQEPYGLL